MTTAGVDPSRLASLDADSWAAVLTHVREVLAALPPDEIGDEGARLARQPVSRLSGGRGRRSLCAYLTASPQVMAAVVRSIEEAGADALLEPLRLDDPPVPAEDAAHDDRAARDRERLRRAREERDEATRRADGAEARATRLAAEVAGLESRIAELESALDEARAALADTEHERARAVERERRRQDARIAELEERIRTLRRAEDERRATQRRVRERREPSAPQPPRVAEAPRILPGRPTRLPDGVHPRTREAADLLLGRDRLVLIDGYNLTKTHRPAATLEEQRTWLVQLIAPAVARRGIRPTVVFDGERAGNAPSPRGVGVRFTESGVTADDEIVLWVEATNEPVVVVTDDRELGDRVTASGADVLATGPFLWAIR
jgi:hypothetical protein